MSIKQNFIKIILSICTISLLVAGFFKQITAYTQDLGRHLLTGKIIVETFSVPNVNLFSYTHPQFPFINHHFLSEVIFYLVFLLFGNNGLQTLTIIVIFAAFGLIYFYAGRRYSYPVAAVISFLYLGVLFERNDIRPELFSFLFLSIFITILFKNREKFTRLIYLLPLISLLWVNIHIYFFVGIVVLILFVIDAFFQKKEILKQLCVVLGICLIAILINPNFINGAVYPLKVFGNYGYTIEENQSIFLLESLGFQKVSVGYLKIAAFLLFLALFLNYRKARVIDWLLAITFTYTALVAVRNLPLFVFATFIPFGKNLYDISLESSRKLLKRYSYASLLVSLIIIGFFLWQINLVINKNQIGFGVAPGAERGVDFFLEQNLHGPIFNNFDIGSYLIYRLYPKEKVFIDGRPEAYPATFIQQTYIPMQEDLGIFEQVDKQYHFQAIFFSHTDMTPWGQKFLGEIVKNNNWKTIYLDETSIILLKQTGENQVLIKKYGMMYPDFKLSPIAKTDMMSLMKLANFYQLTGALDNQIETYKKILSKEVNYCPAIYNLAVLLGQKNDSMAHIYALRYKNGCEKMNQSLN